MEERVGVGDTILLIVHGSVQTTALLEVVSLRPVLDKSRLVTGQSKLVHLGVGRITNADGQPGKRQKIKNRVLLTNTNKPSLCRMTI